MKELYWITICGNINLALWIFFGFALVGLITAIVVLCDCYGCDEEEDKRTMKFIKIFSVTAVFCVILVSFVPSKKDMYMIYGVGSVIDYYQDSDEAKKLPDKTLKMLNQLCDKYIKEEEKQ